ncbi:MAG: hypothetical protein KDA44_01500, partial [Planctomycetales bacterium]|nr:hypothetical protein [Planctomycetales bacterium]
MKRRRTPRPLNSLNLSLEHLEDRRLLTADPNFPGNDNAPILDLSGLQANSLTINAGATASFNLYDIGATLADTQGGTTFTDFAAGRLLLKDAGLGATLSTSGAFEFTPAESNRSFNFTVMALDRPTTAGQPPRMDTETFTIMVRPPNQAPSFTLAKSTLEGVEDPSPAVVTLPNFALAISDGDGGTDIDAFTVALDATAANTAGLFAVGGEPSIANDGTLTYTPAADANGSATFFVTLKDNGGTAAGGMDTSVAKSITITVTPVNDKPEITLGTSAVMVDEDAPVTISDISITDKDVDETAGGTVKVTLAAGKGAISLTPASIATLDFASAGAAGDGDADATMTFFGTLANVNAALAAGVSYQGNTDFNGADMLTVTVDDQGNTGAGGNLTDSKQIAITVVAVDDLPTISVTDQTVLDSESTLLLPPVVVSDVDLAATGEILVTVGVTAGTLAILPDPTATLSTYTGDGTAALTLQGTLANVNAALTRIFYTPVAGTSSVTLSVTADDQPGASVPPRPATATGTLTVVADTNTAPKITNPTPPAEGDPVTLEPTQGELFTQVFTATDTPGETLLFSVSPAAGFAVPDGLVFGGVTETPIDATTSQYTATLTWPADKVVAGMFGDLFVNVADAGLGAGGLGAKSDTVPLVLDVIQVITVTTTEDVINPADDETELGLREAIILANATPGKAKIRVPEGTYKLTITGSDEDAAATGDLDITDELTIVGADAATTIIDASGDVGLGDRVFDVLGSVNVMLQNLTITGGTAGATGGDDGRGGGVRHDGAGMLTILSSSVTGNSATGAGGGVARNGAGTGAVQIFGSTIVNNTSQASGGGASFEGSQTQGLFVISSTFSGNKATGSGGGIWIFDDQGAGADVFVSQFVGNTAGGNGGGIFNGTGAGGADSGPLTIKASTIADNSSGGFGGGLLHLSDQSPLTLRDSTVAHNMAVKGGGGVSNATQLGVSSQIINSTVSDNSTAAAGGGVSNSYGSLEILHSTITDNAAADGSGSGVASFGGAAGASTVVSDSIVAHNKFDDVAVLMAVVETTSNTFTSLGFNLVGSGSAVPEIAANAIEAFNQTGDQTAVDPLLGPLQDNGGSTKTHALLAGSPAIDAGDPNFSAANFVPELTTDQRGAPRERGAAIDVGAFESDLFVNNEGEGVDTTPNDGVVGDGGANQFLRAAIQEANSNPDHSTIVLPAGTFNLDRVGNDDNAAFGDLDITEDVTIIGAGAGLTVIDASGGATVVNDRVFHVLNGANVQLAGLTITGGKVDGAGGGLFVEDGTVTLANSEVIGNATTGSDGTHSGGGAAIAAAASLAINRSTIDGNTASDEGGGILNLGTLVVDSSTISNNNATGGGGAGIANWGNATIRSSTISGNKALGTGQQGGGIFNYTGTTTMLASTVTNNTSSQNGGLASTGAGATFHIGSSLVAGNTSTNGAGANPDVKGDFSSLGHNLIGVADAGQGFVDGDNGDMAGIAIAINPELEALADNGGPTMTHALKFDSPALNAGSNPAGLLVDQRGAGFPRVVGGQADIGAFEFRVQGLMVDTDSDVSDGNFSAGNFSLREALELANAGFGLDTITFDPTFFGAARTIALTSTLPEITLAIAIDGPGAELLTISGGGGTDGTIGNGDGFVVFLVDAAVSAAPAVVRGVTVTGGDSGSGGGFRVEGALSVQDSVVAGNGSAAGGGGFYLAANAKLDVLRTTISGNIVGTLGGGIAALGGTTVTIVDSTLSANETGGDNGGAIFNQGNLVVQSSTISGNKAGGVGGGISNEASGNVRLTNSTVMLNSAGSVGGLSNINDASGSFEIGNSIVAKNQSTPFAVDVFGVFTSLGHNWIGDIGIFASGLVIGTNNDQIGTSAAPIDPVLGALQDNGGPTF